MEKKQWNVISLGAGVQSSVLALMASRGELLGIKVDFAIFADTQDESKTVYDWLDWLESQLSFPVHRVTHGKLSAEALKERTTKDGLRKYTRTVIPVYTLGHDGSRGKVGFRTCTIDYKINQITKELRRSCGIKRGQKEQTVTSLIGISYDEMQRMKDSREPWVVNRYPLVEMKMTRQACIQWMQDRDYPKPPRSSCVFCPFHSNHEWLRLKNEEPEEFQKAVEFEKQLQISKAQTDNFKTTPYLHNSRTPLESIDFEGLVKASEEKRQVSGFIDECDGMCGV